MDCSFGFLRNCEGQRKLRGFSCPTRAPAFGGRQRTDGGNSQTGRRLLGGTPAGTAGRNLDVELGNLALDLENLIMRRAVRCQDRISRQTKITRTSGRAAGRERERPRG